MRPKAYTVPIIVFLGWPPGRGWAAVLPEGEVIEPEAIGDSLVNLTDWVTSGMAAI